MVGNRLSRIFYLTNICIVQTLLGAQHRFLNFGKRCCELAQKRTRSRTELRWAHCLKAGRCGGEGGNHRFLSWVDDRARVSLRPCDLSQIPRVSFLWFYTHRRYRLIQLGLNRVSALQGGEMSRREVRSENSQDRHRSTKNTALKCQKLEMQCLYMYMFSYSIKQLCNCYLLCGEDKFYSQGPGLKFGFPFPTVWS